MAPQRGPGLPRFMPREKRTCPSEKWTPASGTRRVESNSPKNRGRTTAARVALSPSRPPPVRSMVQTHLLGHRFLVRPRDFLTLERAHCSPAALSLEPIGTDPREAEGGGMVRKPSPTGWRGRKLGVPTYLESTNPDNERFYVRQGFKAVKEVRRSLTAGRSWSPASAASSGASRPAGGP